MAFFEGLVVDESGKPLQVEYVGGESAYVVDDRGFLRHVDSAPIDRAILSQFTAQLVEHSGEASRAILQMMGQEDLFTKAMVDAQLRSLDVEQIRQRQLPLESRQMLAMMGFRIVLDVHGVILRVDMPAAPDEGEE
jgi:hypothetical protein